MLILGPQQHIYDIWVLEEPFNVYHQVQFQKNLMGRLREDLQC